MRDNFFFESNLLYQDGECFVSFVSDIEKFLVLENSIVILLKYSPSIGDQNIFCFDFKKKKLWQIVKPISLHSENYFSAIYLRGYELYAYNINGVEYHLDKETGIVLNTELIK